MVRRSTPQKKKDDDAFPIRVKIVIPPFGFGQTYDEIEFWLRSEIGRGNYARHAARSYPKDASAFYFRSIEDARRFLAAFPALELRDGTIMTGYTSPALPFGRG